MWFAHGPQFEPKMLWSSGADDGQELSDLVISNDDRYVVYVRGGDHDENWPVPLQPNPASFTIEQQEASVVRSYRRWSAEATRQRRCAGDYRPTARVSCLWMGPVPSKWRRRTEVRRRSGYSSIAVRIRICAGRPTVARLRLFPVATAITVSSASTATARRRSSFLRPRLHKTPCRDGHRTVRSIAFIRTPGAGGSPQNPLNWNPQPWEIWVAQPDSILRGACGRAVQRCAIRCRKAA